MNNIYLLVLIALLGLPLHAQDEEMVDEPTSTERPDFQVGILGGINYATLQHYFDDSDDPLYAFHFGVTSEFKVSDNFSFMPSLIYSVEGETVELNGTDIEAELYYLNIPVHMKYYVAGGLSVFGGPQLSLYLDSDIESSTENEFSNVEADNAVDSYFAASGGIAYDFNFGLFIRATYIHGVTDVFENETRADQQQRSRVVQASIGFKF